MKTKSNFSKEIFELFDPSDFKDDCPYYDEIPTFLDCKKRIIAIGDIHGDLDVAIRSFKLANLIDNDMNWIAIPADTVVVQVGDQIDSFREANIIVSDKAEDLKVMEFFDDMHIRASKYGGAVYSLIGNHELLNMLGRFEYVSKNNMYFNEYTNHVGEKVSGGFTRQALFDRINQNKSASGTLCKKIACNRPAIIIIGDILFVHGGLLPEWIDELEYLNTSEKNKLIFLNKILRKWILNKMDLFDDKTKTVTNNMINNIDSSPFWTRVFGMINSDVAITDDQSCKNILDKSLKVFKLGKMVIGHTPQGVTNNSEKSINGTCYTVDPNGVKKTNKLYRIDGGFSRAFDPYRGKKMVVEVLEIIDCEKFTIVREQLD